MSTAVRRVPVAHITTAHQRYDTRIFLKQCRSLAAAGYEVSLVVADGKGDEERDGVRILDAGKPRGRFDRMWTAARRAAARVLETGAGVIQLHDPELLPHGLNLKRRGKIVIFDSHEDVPRQILSKPYLHPALRGAVSGMFGRFEHFACARLDAVLAATPAVGAKFEALGIPAVVINNYPMAGELESSVGWGRKQQQVCYVGGISAIRGIREIVEAIDLAAPGIRLNLAGEFEEKSLRDEIAGLVGWRRVDELGFLAREQVREVLSRSVAGLVTFLPEPNHLESRPNKLFEYMSAGLPVVASDFPLWRAILEGEDCGLCVDPRDPRAIAAAIDRLIGDPEMAARMGENGRRAVREHYNWAAEEKKLLELYRQLTQKVGANERAG